MESSQDMLKYQYLMLYAQLQLLQDHSLDHERCPCEMKTETSEFCIAKHLTAIAEGYCLETIPMTDNPELKAVLRNIKNGSTDLRREYEEAKEQDKEPDYDSITSFARESRKALEPYVWKYKGKVAELVEMHQESSLSDLLMQSLDSVSLNATRSEIARQSYKEATVSNQRQAEANEVVVARAVGGKTEPENYPFDVLTNKDCIEVKTIISGLNDKITMHPDSLLRKKEFIRVTNCQPHTVVFDDRTGNIYYKNDVGSFRLSSMEQIPSICNLRYKMETSKSKESEVVALHQDILNSGVIDMESNNPVELEIKYGSEFFTEQERAELSRIMKEAWARAKGNTGTSKALVPFQPEITPLPIPVEPEAETEEELPVEDGAIKHPWYEYHHRGKNWIATAVRDRLAPGSLKRVFWNHRAEWYEVPADLKPGNFLEFGSDYYSGSGRKQAERHYARVVVVRPDYIGIDMVSGPASMHQDTSLCDALAARLPDESHDSAIYHGLANEAENQGLLEVGKVLGKISKQEQGHYDMIKEAIEEHCQGDIAMQNKDDTESDPLIMEIASQICSTGECEVPMERLTREDRWELPENEFACSGKMPGAGSYPLPDASHVISAISYYQRPEYQRCKGGHERICEAAKHFGIESSPAVQRFCGKEIKE